MQEKCYRNEYKHIISLTARAQLRARLRQVLPMDRNCGGQSYVIKSLYFDTLDDNALLEKLNGNPYREKFRIRCYNSDYSYIKLEKKVKELQKGYKLYTRLTSEEVRKIIAGETAFLKERGDPLLREFYFNLKVKQLRPIVLIVYEREAYVYKPGNTRITLDSNISSGMDATDFFNDDIPLLQLAPRQCVLEVKFNNFLPDIIRDLIQVNETTSSANSKFAAGRMAAL